MWCNLFVGEHASIEEAIAYFAEDASIFTPNLPYRIDRDEDHEEIVHSHRVDGRGLIHYWQVLEPTARIRHNVAVVTYYARYCIGREGETSTKTAKETLVLVPAGEGWTIMHMHNSL